MTPEEFVLLNKIADASYVASVKILTLTSFYGAYLVIFLCSVSLLRKRIHTSNPARWLLGLVTLLGVTMTLHFTAGIVTFLPEILWVRYGSSGDTISTKYTLSQNAHSILTEIATLAPSINFVLGDIIVVWRAYVLWPNSRAFRLFLVIFLAFITLFAIVFYAFSVQDSIPIAPALRGKLGAVRYTLSLGLNFIATVAMGIKTWRHRQEVKQAMNGSGSRSFITKVLLLLTECGALFCVAQLLLAILQGTTSKYARTNPTHPAYIATIIMIEFCVAYAAMYPSIIIVALEIYGSFLEGEATTFNLRTVATIDMNAIPMSDSVSSNQSPTEKSSSRGHPHSFSPIRFADYDAIRSQDEMKRSLSFRKQGYLRPLTAERSLSNEDEQDLADLHRHPTPTAL